MNGRPKAGERAERSATLNRQSVTEDGRVSLSVASETPVRRWYGDEVLLMSGADLSRLRDGAPALADHRNTIDSIAGVIERAWVDADKLRATIALADTQKGREVRHLIESGALRGVSIGYTIDQIRETPDGIEAIAWTPYECSFTPVGADPSVGIGRAAQGGRENMYDNNDGGGASGGAQATHTRVDVDTARSEAQAAERDRCVALRSLGKTHEEFGGEEIAEALVASGGAIEDLFRAVRERQERAYRDEEVENRRRGRSAAILPSGRRGDDPSNFSFRRLILQGLHRAGTKGFGAKDLDRDCPDWQGPETERTGESNRGKQGPCYTVGADILGSVRWSTRELTSGTGTNQGGNLVAQDFLESEFVSLLRNSSSVVQHARILADLVGDVEIPKQTGGRAATWLSETGALALTDPSFGQLTLSPKELGAATQYTRKLLLQATPDIEMLIRMDLAETIALGLDLAAINGSGSSNQPTGILNVTGIGSVSASGTAIGNKGAPFTWADIVALESEVAADNALGTSPLYVMNAAARGHAKTTLKGGSASDAFIWDNSTPGTPVNGHMTSVSNQMPTNLTVDSGSVATAILFGDAQSLTVGLWSGIDIEVNPYLKLLTRQIQVVAYQDVDLILRNAESWAAITNAYFGS